MIVVDDFLSVLTVEIGRSVAFSPDSPAFSTTSRESPISRRVLVPSKTTWRVVRLTYKPLKMPSVKSAGASSARKDELNDEALESENSLENDRLNARENDEPLDIEACGAAS